MDNVEPRLDREDQQHPQAIQYKRRRAHTVDLETGAAERRLQSEADGDAIDVSISFDDDGLQVSRRRISVQRRTKRKLSSSRCVRGLLVLCVYGVMVLHQPSSDTFLTPPLPLMETTHSTAAAGNSTTTATTRTLEEAKALRMAALPKFGKPPATATATVIKKAKYHSTLPPNAVHGVTHTNGTTTHWHKIPPTIYHKKQRPILSHAHSYQLHQAPLVFGREESPSFFGSSSDEGGSSSYYFSSYLIWISLIVLLVDTTYREWQHYRFQQLTAATPQERRQRHYRRSPSPRRRSDSF